MANRQLLARATEGTSAPTPGYLYQDLAKAASSNPSACQEMAQYLTNRLQSKQSSNIKFKCLKVIAKLCEQVPRNQFRRCVQQSPQGVGAIKECLNFRGPLDPVRGDEPNQKVRSAAQEAIDAVYREASSSELAATGQSYAGAGIGSSSYGPSPHAGGGGGAAAGYGAGPRRMEGIGNPRYSDPRLDPKWNNGNNGQPANIQEAVKEAGEVILGMIKDPLARNVEIGIGGPGSVPRQGHSELPGYGAHRQAQSSQYGRPPPGQAELARQTGGQWTMASNRGPGAVQPPSSAYARETEEYYKPRDTSYNWASQQGGGGATRPSSGGVGGSWASASAAAPPSALGAASHATPSIHVTPNPHHHAAPAAGPPVSDGSYERQLVLELCPPGGMKAVPPPDKLANFTKVVPSLNSDLVCPVLLDCLEEGQPWVIRAKALCVMETCLTSGARADGSNPYRDFFYACSEEIVPLASHARNAIHEPAKRVIALLGLDLPEGYAASAAAAAPISAPAAPPPNLLDFDDAPAPAPAAAPPVPQPAAAAPPAAAAAPSSLFGGMTVKSGSAAAPTPTPAPQAAQSGGSLLDDFQPQSAVPASAPATSNNSDIFRDVAVKQQNGAGNSIAPPMSLFDQMNLKDNEDKKSDSEDAGDITSLASGSAFGFINESKSKEEQTHEQQHHAPPAAPESFDPLKNFSPNTAQKKMMQLSQEQMQAMAYQQMMMQQQMQMQRAYMAGGQQFPGGMHPGMPPNAFMGGMPMHYPGVLPGGVKLSMGAGPNNMNARAAKKDDKKFDFVKDAMQANKK